MIAEGLTKERLKDRNYMKDLEPAIAAKGDSHRRPDLRRRTSGLRPGRFWINPEERNSCQIDWNLQALADFQKLRRLRKELPGLGDFPVKVVNDHQAQEVQTPEVLLQFFLEEGKKGLTIQRYKGLGEMNPQQLWETTMDPEHRTLLKVRVEDMVEADQIFTILMGDQVEPRRDFIYQNALEVRELDI